MSLPRDAESETNTQWSAVRIVRLALSPSAHPLFRRGFLAVSGQTANAGRASGGLGVEAWRGCSAMQLEVRAYSARQEEYV